MTPHEVQATAEAIADRLLTVFGPGGPARAIAPVLPDGTLAGEYARFEIIDAIRPFLQSPRE